MIEPHVSEALATGDLGDRLLEAVPASLPQVRERNVQQDAQVVEVGLDERTFVDVGCAVLQGEGFRSQAYVRIA